MIKTPTVLVLGAFIVCLLCTSCNQNAKREDIKIGMTINEVKSLTSMKLVSENRDAVQYSCLLDGCKILGMDSNISGSNPYLLTFVDGILTEILYDKNAALRRQIKYKDFNSR